MDESLCKLTLAYAPKAEAELVALLLDAEPPLDGFFTWRADGHGLDFAAASLGERVRGRVTRGMLVLVLPRIRVEPLLERIRLNSALTGLSYWVEPVEQYARLAPEQPQPDAP